MGCGLWGEQLIHDEQANYYANRYAPSCSLSKELIYQLAFFAERMLECESVDEAVEKLIEYEEKRLTEERVLNGLNNMVSTQR